MFLTHDPCTLRISKDGIMGEGWSLKHCVQNGAHICSVCEMVLSSPQIFESTHDC